ncbi:MAG: glycosyltransferase [Verrucomicrobiota bacterium]
MRVHDIRRSEIIDVLAEDAPEPRLIANVNAHAINLALKDAAFLDILNHAHACFCDGFGVKVLAALFRRGTIRDRTTMPGFVEEVAARLHGEGKRLFLLGDEPGVAEAYAKKLEARWPGVVAGTHHGFILRDPAAEAEALRAAARGACRRGDRRHGHAGAGEMDRGAHARSAPGAVPAGRRALRLVDAEPPPRARLGDRQRAGVVLPAALRAAAHGAALRRRTAGGDAAHGAVACAEWPGEEAMTRLLIYAQVPPPLHGQSAMVAHLLDGLREAGQRDLTAPAPPAGAEPAIAFVHVNPQLSDDLADIGRWRLGKVLSVFRYIAAAIRARFRYGVDAFYFVPAPPRREALYRDWAVLLLCRPFFRRLILHWHCIGQRDFLTRKVTAPERWLAHLCYGGADISITLSKYSEDEASMFHPRRSVIVPNGIPDPCPDFDDTVWPGRRKRAELLALGSKAAAPLIYDVLFVAGRMTAKGLFDAMAAVTRVNRRLGERRSPLRMRLTAAGPFQGDEAARFEVAARELNATQLAGVDEPLCVYAGWVNEAKKRELYRRADCLLFPTFYPAESFGLVVAEAMAHGCAVITTRWQAVPEVLPPGDPNVVEPHDIEAMATALLRCAAAAPTRALRDRFVAHFTRERFMRGMTGALAQPE